jgi:hypothetical protein
MDAVKFKITTVIAIHSVLVLAVQMDTTSQVVVFVSKILTIAMFMILSLTNVSNAQILIILCKMVPAKAVTQLQMVVSKAPT